MTADRIVPPAAVRVQVWAADPGAGAEVRAALARAGAVVEPGSGARMAGTVAVGVGRTVEDALTACPSGPGRDLLIVAEAFGPDGVLRAVRRGVRVMLRRSDTTDAQLDAALACARQGDGWMPHEAVVALLTRIPDAPVGTTGGGVLTRRQAAVLSLMAEGHGNAAIARALSCSEHTVKNVSYELMARLQVRNRAQAVARGLIAGLV